MNNRGKLRRFSLLTTIFALLFSMVASFLVSVPVSAVSANEEFCAKYKEDNQGTQDEYDACIDGYKNYKVSGYCDWNMADKMQINACNAGVDYGTKNPATDNPGNSHAGYSSKEEFCSYWRDLNQGTATEYDSCLDGVEHKDDANWCKENTGNRLEETSCMAGAKYANGTFDPNDPFKDIMDLKRIYEECKKLDDPLSQTVICPIMINVHEALNNLVTNLLNNTLPFDIGKLSENQDFTATMNRFRDLANIAFAVMFLIVIYSTIFADSFSPMSNYNVKKILPKLVLTAILVNISFYLCAVAADFTNIVGAGIKDFVAPGDAGNYGVGMITGTMVGSIGIIIVLLLAWSTALIAVILFVVLLLARQIILAALVLVSPIALVLWLLPNTEKWFKKWFDLFLQLLVIYPIIMLVWGVSMLTSTVTTATFSAGGEIIGALITSLSFLIPLLVAVPLLKGTSKIMGTIHGATGKFTKPATDKLGAINKENRERIGKNIHSSALQAGGPIGSIAAIGIKHNEKLEAARGRNTRRRQTIGATYAQKHFKDQLDVANAIGRLDKINSAEDQAYATSLSYAMSGLSFNQQLDYLDAEIGRQSTARDADKIKVALKSLGSMGGPGLAKMETSMLKYKVGATGNVSFDNKVKTYIGANKSTFVGSAGIYQFATGGGAIDGDIDIAKNKFKTSELAMQSVDTIKRIKLTNDATKEQIKTLLSSQQLLDTMKPDQHEAFKKLAKSNGVKIPKITPL